MPMTDGAISAGCYECGGNEDCERLQGRLFAEARPLCCDCANQPGFCTTCLEALPDERFYAMLAETKGKTI